MLALKIVGLLLFFFGFIISMAISSGLTHAMWLETDGAKEGKIFHSRRVSDAVKEYRRRNPEGRKHIQARNAGLVGMAFFLGMLGYVWIISR